MLLLLSVFNRFLFMLRIVDNSVCMDVFFSFCLHACSFAHHTVNVRLQYKFMFPMSLVSIPFKLVYLVFCGNGFKIPSLMASWLTGLGSCVPVSAVCSTPGTENKQKTKLYYVSCIAYLFSMTSKVIVDWTVW